MRVRFRRVSCPLPSFHLATQPAHTHTRTGDVGGPDGSVVSDVRPHAVPVVRIPQGRVVVLGARKQQIALLVVQDERQRPVQRDDVKLGGRKGGFDGVVREERF